MNRIGKTRAFLTEFIIVILFFSLSAIITLQLFLAANDKSRLSSDKTVAYIKVQNIAEEVKAYNIYADNFFSAANGWDSNTRYYDSSFRICNKEDASYVLHADITKEEKTAGVMTEVELSMEQIELENKQGEELCRIIVKTYLSDGGSE